MRKKKDQHADAGKPRRQPVGKKAGRQRDLYAKEP